MMSVEVNTTSLLIELPLDVILLTASYFSMKDQRTLSHCSKSCRSMMRTANLIPYKLSRESSRRYVNDLSYRDAVDSRGHVWDFSLSLHRTLVDVTFLSRVHTVKLSHCDAVIDVSPLSSVHTLTLISMSEVTDVSALSSVHTLTLIYMAGLTDVSALSSVPNLIISNCRHLKRVERRTT